MGVLDDIVDGVRQDLAERQAAVSLDRLKERVLHVDPALDPMPRFRESGVSVIAEVKRSSPSKGALAQIADPAALASAYADGGAAAIADAMARCDVSQFESRRLNELSAGERARVLLARALATQAPILLVDEPAAHLDPAHQLQLMELLRAEAARGVAVAITLHDLSLASRFCDEIVVLRNGHVAGQGAPEEVLSDAALAQVFGIAAKRLEGNVVPWSRV